MTDLTGVTLTATHYRTPELAAFNAHREAERQAREDQKRARLAHIRAVNAAAIESQKRPVKAAKAKPTKPAKANPLARPQTPVIAPCTGTCGRLTRGSHITADRAPGTVRRYRDGKCETCATGGTPASNTGPRPCPTCGRMTRPHSHTLTEYPGTVLRRPGGKCDRCTRLGDNAGPRDHIAYRPPVNLDTDTLKAEYEAGATFDTLATRHGASATAIRRHLINAGINPRKPGDTQRGKVKTYPAELVAQVRHHYTDQRKSQTDTAKACGVSVDTVITIMRRHGIPARTTAGARGNR